MKKLSKEQAKIWMIHFMIDRHKN